MNLDAFLTRCDRLMERRAQLGRPLSEARLSTILFSSGPRLARLREKRRIFEPTLAAAEQLLAAEEAKLAGLGKTASANHQRVSTARTARPRAATSPPVNRQCAGKPSS